MFEAVQRLLQEAVSEGAFPGCALTIGWGRESKNLFVGNLDTDGLPVNESTCYELGILTGMISVTVLTLLALEEGKLTLDDSVTLWLTDVPGELSGITVRRLLNHSSGISPYFHLSEEASNSSDAVNAILRHPLLFAPGSSVKTSAMGIMLLGFILEKVYEMPLDKAVRQYVTIPLEMNNTSYLPSGGNIAPAFSQNAGREWQAGQPMDENTQFMHGVSGHSGLFTCLDDLRRFLSMMALKGRYQGCAYLSEASVALLSKCMQVSREHCTSLGFRVHSSREPFLGTLLPEGSIALTDPASGCLAAIDPSSGFYIGFLCNGRFDAGMRSEMERFHKQLTNAAYAAWQKGYGDND